MNQHNQEPTRIEPLSVTKKQAFALVNSSKMVQRWLYWSRRAAIPSKRYVIIVREGGRGKQTLIDFQSLKRAYSRWLAGDEPPPLPSEGGNK